MPHGDAFEIFGDNLRTLAGFFQQLPPEKADFRYADGKWTIKEVLQHLIDTERIMAYRALTFMRGDTRELPGFDENVYAANADVSQRSLESLITEFSLLRQSHFWLFKNMSPEVSQIIGVANGYKISVRALFYIMTGHVLHHLRIIEERYQPFIG